MDPIYQTDHPAGTRFKKLIVFLLCVISFRCSQGPVNHEDIAKSNFYTQSSANRLAAEWEPALGVMIVWPLSIPYKLVIELAKDTRLFTLVENAAAREEAMQWYHRWEIDTTKIEFVYAPQGVDAWWVRDWGPGAVFNPEKRMMLADGRYIYSTPITDILCNDSLNFLYKTEDNQIVRTDTDDEATVYLGKAIGIDVLDLPFISTGGNVLTDGLGTAFSTCVLMNENRFFGVGDDQFFDLNKKLLGIDRYQVLSNFEKEGIQHIDCYLKPLDEERLLIIEPPHDHALYEIYENIIVNEVSKLKSAYGRPYEVLRIKSARYRDEHLAAYTNSIIINKTIYVPLFKIKEDEAALQTWKNVMPGYTVKGFEFDLSDEPILSAEMKEHYRSGYGWDSGDALHCRTRAIWDPGMLFMSVKRIDSIVDAGLEHTVYVTVIDYSKKGLQKDAEILRWRPGGTQSWNEVRLIQIENTDHFYGQIPGQSAGTRVEYYVQASSLSGTTETAPRTAPLGVYSYLTK